MSLRLAQALAQAGAGQAQRNEPLAPWVTVRAGGAADVLLRPHSVDALVAALRVAHDEGAQVSLLGGGANTLVGDFGVRGLTLKLPSDLAPETVEPTNDGGLVTLSAGAAIARLVNVMKQHAWVGAEALAGIPGTLGGAVAMNAGTKNGECMRIVDAVELATKDGVGWIEVARIPFEYRHTHLPAGSVVTRVRFRLRHGDVEASQAAMAQDLAYRKRTQPLSLPNFGSVFTNPPGHHAGQLIETVGLKGHRIGNAQISTLHANWIVNVGQATARDVESLMELASTRVFDATGIKMTPEVKRLGQFEP